MGEAGDDDEEDDGDGDGDDGDGGDDDDDYAADVDDGGGWWWWCWLIWISEDLKSYLVIPGVGLVVKHFRSIIQHWVRFNCPR